MKNYQKNRRVHTVAKTRLKFLNSKIAYKKKYVKKQKFQKKIFEFGPFLKKL